ncbi:MAG: acyl-CoA reductase [Bacteroidetes bacterium]|nr:MAG: acyl-CoA reductase [Bacteroidota bacterium]
MDIRNRIQTFVEAGRILKSFPQPAQGNRPHPLLEASLKAEAMNPWFTRDYIRYALNALGESLSGGMMEQWLDPYMKSFERCTEEQKTIGVVTAGNIPLAGFHDFICVLISGHAFCGKLSRQDNCLLPAISGIMENINPAVKDFIQFTDEPFTKVDAIIATGSDNTYRYFEKYFSRFPNIIRKNRNGVAVLTGYENANELSGLASDVMLYFGMGCRSVSKIYIPADYDVTKLSAFFEPWSDLIRHNKYYNNYEYQKSIRIVNKKPYCDFGNLLLSEENSLASPVSVLNYERYADMKVLREDLAGLSEKIQCVVSASDPGVSYILPGSAQTPRLWDYADGTDTLDFLLNEI